MLYIRFELLKEAVFTNQLRIDTAPESGINNLQSFIKVNLKSSRNFVNQLKLGVIGKIDN